MLHRAASLFALLLAVVMLAGCPDNSAPNPNAGPVGDPDLSVNPGPEVHGDHDHDDHGEEDIIHEVMEKLNEGRDAPTRRIGAALEADPVDWATIRQLVPQYVELAEQLPGATPPKGPQASWEGFAKAYAASANALQSAVEIESVDAAKTAHLSLTNSCKPCHNVHKP